MTCANKSNETVNGRIIKANVAWGTVKNTFVADINIPIKPRLILFHALIGSVLFYGLHHLHISNTNLNKIQSFYSKCIRIIVNGNIPFNPNTRNETNESIRNTYNIFTIRSKLHYLKINTYLNWVKTLPLSCLNQIK